MDSQVVQPTSDCHHEIVILGFGIPEEIFDNTAAFNPTNDMFNANPNPGDEAIGLFLLGRQVLAFRFLLRLKRHDPRRFIPLKAGIFIQRTVLRPCGVFVISNLFVMPFTFVGLAQVIDFARMETANDEILDRMRFFFPL